MDKVAIIINCDNHTVKIEAHPTHVQHLDAQTSESARAEIIARIVSPQIRSLMAMPITTLNEKYLDLLAGKLQFD
jgi:hypothetical protein